MQAAEVARAIDWAAAEGWNPGLHDGALFYSTDPHGFFIGVLDGEPIATLAGVAYDGSYGFLGLYIVKPEHRGKGYGLRLWQEATAYLGERNVGLDGVLEQQANYEGSGFTLAYRNVRYQGRRPDGVSERGAETSGEVVPITDVPFDELVRYDAACFPVARPAFLGRWTTQPESSALALLRGGALTGFGVVRQCREGYKVGPLFADDAQSADALFLALASGIEGDAPLYLDVPQPHAEAVRLAERYGMQPSFETVRMYSRGEPAMALDRIFGVTTFELG